MRRALSFLAFTGAVLAGCATLIGVEPLSGSDAGPESGADAVVAPDAGCAVWVDASGGYVPPGAVNAEPIDAQTVTIYVCRTASGGSLIPGKLRPNYGCYFGDDDGGAEGFSMDYQVLTPVGCTPAWMPSPSGVTPASAVPCGEDPQGLLYSCRVTQPALDEGELGHMGWGTNHECIYSLSGLSLTSTVFDVLSLY